MQRPFIYIFIFLFFISHSVCSFFIFSSLSLKGFVHSLFSLLYLSWCLFILYDFEIQRTPLHFANQSNAIEIAQLLIERGADINAKGNIYQITFHQIFIMFVLISFFILNKNTWSSKISIWSKYLNQQTMRRKQFKLYLLLNLSYEVAFWFCFNNNRWYIWLFVLLFCFGLN